MPRILLADDDAELCSMLAEYLADEGYETEAVHDGQMALTRARKGDFELVILDVMMPRKSGLEVLRELREQSLIPVLMLTARGDDMDSVLGLELGADDYLAKPCNPRVLSARIRAVLRRAHPGRGTEESMLLQCGDLVMSTGARTLQRSGESVSLTSTEFSVLEILLRNAGRSVSKA